MTRWVLTEEATAATWTMTLNPNTMDHLPAGKTLTYAYPSRNTQDRMRTFQTPTTAPSFSWGGVIRSKAHYDQLRAWSRKPGVIVVTDHLGRRFRVLMQSFKPDRRAGRRTDTYRMKYVMTTQWLERIS